jgi:hypothetical protein
MRTAGERSVFCVMAMIVAVASAHATTACAAQKAGKPAKGPGAAAADNAPQAKISFKVKPETVRPLDLSAPATGFAPRDVDVEMALDGGFSLSPAATTGDARLLDADRYYDDRGLVTWRSNAYAYQREAGGPIDSVRVSVAQFAPAAGVAPLILARPDAYETRDVDVTVTRGWPSAVSLQGRKFALDVTPHAGVGFGGAGGSAEAGATVRLGKKKNMGDRVNDALGVREGDEAFGQRGRWYIFAAASGRAVGLNMLRGQNGDWSRAGLSQDATSRLIGDSQAGVAWRKGPMQASLGYIHREIKAKEGIMGLATQKDDVVALSFSLKPHW